MNLYLLVESEGSYESPWIRTVAAYLTVEEADKAAQALREEQDARNAAYEEQIKPLQEWYKNNPRPPYTVGSLRPSPELRAWVERSMEASRTLATKLTKTSYDYYVETTELKGEQIVPT